VNDWEWTMTPDRKRRHVALGRRLEVLQLIRAGRISCEAAAALMEVSIREVYRWQAMHAADHIVALGRPDGRAPTPEESDLLARRRRLVRLLRNADASLRRLHARLLATTRPRSATGQPRQAW
jgi:hypothetical protein